MSSLHNNKRDKHSKYLHYKDFVGSVEFSEEDGVFHGKVVGIKSLISFEGDSVSSIIEDFHNAIDEWLFALKMAKRRRDRSKGLSTFVSAAIFTVKPCS